MYNWAYAVPLMYNEIFNVKCIMYNEVYDHHAGRCRTVSTIGVAPFYIIHYTFYIENLIIH